MLGAHFERPTSSLVNNCDRDPYRKGVRKEACRLVQALEVAVAAPTGGETDDVVATPADGETDASPGLSNDLPTVGLGREITGPRIRYPNIQLRDFVPKLKNRWRASWSF